MSSASIDRPASGDQDPLLGGSLEQSAVLKHGPKEELSQSLVTPTPSNSPITASLAAPNHPPSATATPATTCVCASCCQPLSISTTLPAKYLHGIYTCDQCKSNGQASAGVYHCHACSWDCCPTCAPSARAAQRHPTTAPRGCGKCSRVLNVITALPPHYKNGVYVCDKCRNTCRDSSGVYHCQACGWDCCPPCAVPVPRGCGKCRRPLSVGVTLPPEYKNGVYSCDKCRLNRNATEGVYRCNACAWDCCPMCAWPGQMPPAGFAPRPLQHPGFRPQETAAEPPCQKCHAPLSLSTDPDLLAQYPTGEFGCDVCHAKCTASDGLYPCEKCSWVCCRGCGTRLSSMPKPITCGKCSTTLTSGTTLPAAYKKGKYSCDKCGQNCKASEGVYHCEDCDWDCCLACTRTPPSRQPSLQPQPVPRGMAAEHAPCPKCHAPLPLLTNPNLPEKYKEKEFGCDVCHAQYTSSNGLYSCEKCTWVCCRGCGARASAAFQPPMPTSMAFMPCGKCHCPVSRAVTLPQGYKNGAYSCDQCHVTQNAAEGVYHCNACEWDCCAKCTMRALALKGPKVVQPPASAAAARASPCQLCQTSLPLLKDSDIPEKFAAGEFGCDVCHAQHASSDGLFYCEKCTWVCCHGCGARRSSQCQMPKPIPCGKCQRPLSATAALPADYKKGAYSCDHCHATCKARDGVYHCHDCGWDCCMACTRPQPQRRIQPLPQGVKVDGQCQQCSASLCLLTDPSLAEEYTGKKFDCDVCHAQSASSNGLYHCEKCAWVCCRSCGVDLSGGRE